MYDKNLWEDVVKFHGHSCPGLAIGFKVAMYAKTLLNISDKTDDEEIVVVAETDACGVDAIQYVLHATLGTGSLKIDFKGKQVFNIYNRKYNKSIRLYFNGDTINHDIPREERVELILNGKDESMFTVSSVKHGFPEHARIYQSVNCEKCGEKTADICITTKKGVKLCPDCA